MSFNLSEFFIWTVFSFAEIMSKDSSFSMYFAKSPESSSLKNDFNSDKLMSSPLCKDARLWKNRRP